MKYHMFVYFWNPNGTNDVSIYDNNGVEIEYISEALFGVRVDSDVSPISITKALKHIAVNPCSDGSETVETLKKYFKVAV